MIYISYDRSTLRGRPGRRVVALPRRAARGRRRAVRDVDVLAILSGETLTPADPLPPELAVGFLARIETRTYGDSLTIRYASRLDQIHFKLYAMVDQGAGRHEADLRALAPSAAELRAASRWARTHDPSEGFRQELEAALAHLGLVDVDLDA